MDQELTKPGETVIQKDPNNMWVMVEGDGRKVMRTKAADGKIYEQEIPNQAGYQVPPTNSNTTGYNPSPVTNVVNKTVQTASFVTMLVGLVAMIKNLFQKK